jgi:hypothetical protein
MALIKSSRRLNGFFFVVARILVPKLHTTYSCAPFAARRPSLHYGILEDRLRRSDSGVGSYHWKLVSGLPTLSWGCSPCDRPASAGMGQGQGVFVSKPLCTGPGRLYAMGIHSATSSGDMS